MATFTANLPAIEGLDYQIIPNFQGGEFRRPLASASHYLKAFKAAFSALNVGNGDVVYSNCNFHFEIVPLVWLKRRFGYTYLPSHFLFSPFIVENLVRHYRLPALKWLLAWFYERFFFVLAKLFADGFVITNDSDRRHFPARLQKRIIAIYGGVNVEQIGGGTAEKTRDVVFCSRLHPQKGVEGLLDIWALVAKALPKAKLAIIGNGEAAYERVLKDKAERLGIASSLEWLGYVNNEDKYLIYQSAKVFVHSTVFDNNGMVAAEALCSGLPVVMYDLPALEKVYTHGCVKIPYGDKARFADEIVRLLSDQSYRAQVAPNPAQTAELRQYWDWPYRAKLMDGFLKGLNG